MSDRHLVLTSAAEAMDIDEFCVAEWPGRDWGPWNLDCKTYVLWTDTGGYRYEVDLEACTTSAKVLDRICQIAGKQWGGQAHVLAGLVTALDDILSPQAHLCSNGQSRRLGRREIQGLADAAGEGRG